MGITNCAVHVVILMCIYFLLIKIALTKISFFFFRGLINDLFFKLFVGYILIL